MRISSHRFFQGLIVFTIVLNAFRIALPILKSFFIAQFIITILLTLFIYRKDLSKSFLSFIVDFYFPLILFILLVIALVFSGKFYLIVIKDIGNAAVILLLLFILKTAVREWTDLKKIMDFLLLLLVPFSLLLCINSFLFATKILALDPRYSVNGDQNFASLLILMSIIISFRNICASNRKILNLLFLFTILFFTAILVFSGSRRAISVFVLLLIIQLVVTINNHFINKAETKDRFFVYYVITILSSAIIFIIFFTSTSFKFKNTLLSKLNSENIYPTRTYITDALFRYQIVFKGDTQYERFYQKLWYGADSSWSLDPDVGWGSRVHRTIFPLRGTHSEIVPEGACGYLMDSTCNADTWNGNAYSFSMLNNVKVKENDVLLASVFCYVSSDCNATWVRISSEENTYGDVISEYDLKNKDCWQKLAINASCREGRANAYLYFSKDSVTDFRNLKGFVIFAYPTFTIYKSGNYTIIDSLGIGNSSLLSIDKNEDMLLNDFSSFSVASINSGTKELNNVFGKHTNLEFSSFSFFNCIDFWFDESVRYPRLANIENMFILKHDTSYTKMKSPPNFIIDSLSFSEERTNRWEFALYIFAKEYNLKSKLIGGGFTFLNWYGFYFLKDKTASDWPHNPFLSILLYSGILGLLLYLFLLYKVFYYYIKYRKEYGIFFIFFLITFFFSFFSGGSPFDPPIMGFFTLLPFFIHSIHKKDNTKQELNTTNEKDTDHR